MVPDVRGLAARGVPKRGTRDARFVDGPGFLLLLQSRRAAKWALKNDWITAPTRLAV
jgi:hypothetical protein